MSTPITDFRKFVQADVMPCPEPIIDREVLSTIIEFCDKTNILSKEFSITLTEQTIDSDLQNSMDIELSEFFSNMRPVTVLEFNLDGTPKYAKFRDILNTIPDSIWDVQAEDNTIYFSFPSSMTLRIYDRSASENYLFVKLAVKPTRSAEEVDDILMEDWLDVISAGVRYRLLNMPNKEWTDPNVAALMYVDWRRGLSRARMKMLKSYSGKPLEVNPRYFGGSSLWE